mmetsp:Transcript_62310/g.166979  ORF Transcript_62310/g.166979 Transcript_62310/m.166979 type:complete len:279 (-) Transcript_62310:1012-1848(-)
MATATYHSAYPPGGVLRTPSANPPQLPELTLADHLRWVPGGHGNRLRRPGDGAAFSEPFSWHLIVALLDHRRRHQILPDHCYAAIGGDGLASWNPTGGLYVHCRRSRRGLLPGRGLLRLLPCNTPPGPVPHLNRGWGRCCQALHRAHHRLRGGPDGGLGHVGGRRHRHRHRPTHVHRPRTVRHRGRRWHQRRRVLLPRRSPAGGPPAVRRWCPAVVSSGGWGAGSPGVADAPGGGGVGSVSAGAGTGLGLGALPGVGLHGGGQAACCCGSNWEVLEIS